MTVATHRRRGWTGWLLGQAAAGALLFGVASLLARPDAERPGDRALLEALDQARPDVVLLGNSMLHDGVNPDLLQELLDEAPGEMAGTDAAPRVFQHAVGGTYSAYWYLVLKHHVLRAEAPRMVLIPFRDPLLTLSTFRTSGPYAANLRRVASHQDALFAELVNLSPRGPEGWGERVLRRLEAGSSLYAARETLREALFAGLKQAPARWLAGVLPSYAQAAADVLPVRAFDPALDADTMDEALALELLRSPQTFRFEQVVSRSFLPAIVDLCRQHGTRLVLLRLKKGWTPDWTDVVPPGLLDAYTASIDAWLAEQGVTLLDTSRDERLGPWFFRGIDHLSQDGRRYLTLRLAQWLTLWRQDPQAGAAAFAQVLASDPDGAATSEVVVWPVDPATVLHERGHLYRVQLPPFLAADGNDAEQDQRSRWHVHENGQRLRPPHAPLPAIARTGGGAFQHRGASLYFSSSDGSSPRTNGRRYTLRLRRLRLSASPR